MKFRCLILPVLLTIGTSLSSCAATVLPPSLAKLETAMSQVNPGTYDEATLHVDAAAHQLKLAKHAMDNRDTAGAQRHARLGLIELDIAHSRNLAATLRTELATLEIRKSALLLERDAQMSRLEVAREQAARAELLSQVHAAIEQSRLLAASMEWKKESALSPSDKAILEKARTMVAKEMIGTAVFQAAVTREGAPVTELTASLWSAYDAALALAESAMGSLDFPSVQQATERMIATLGQIQPFSTAQKTRGQCASLDAIDAALLAKGISLHLEKDGRGISIALSGTSPSRTGKATIANFAAAMASFNGLRVQVFAASHVDADYCLARRKSTELAEAIKIELEKAGLPSTIPATGVGTSSPLQSLTGTTRRAAILISCDE